VTRRNSPPKRRNQHQISIYLSDVERDALDYLQEHPLGWVTSYELRRHIVETAQGRGWKP
jgi:hypothetical protein